MRHDFVTMKYYETYYYANIVHNVLTDTMPYLRNLNNWHEDREGELFLTPFPKWSVLHDLSYFLIEELIYEKIDDVTLDSIVQDSKSQLWVDEALRYHGFTVAGFRSWLKDEGVPLSDITEDHIHDYHNALRGSGELSELLEQLANEVFFLLFGNRMLLARLNHYVAAAVSHVDSDRVPQEYREYLDRSGIVKRVAIPEWVKRAVFFRDRGMCALCNTDLSGLLTAQTDRHFDHIIPLGESGINDVTNLQLLCEACNLKKGRKLVGTSNRYESWY